MSGRDAHAGVAARVRAPLLDGLTRDPERKRRSEQAPYRPSRHCLPTLDVARAGCRIERLQDPLHQRHYGAVGRVASRQKPPLSVGDTR